MKLRSDYIGLMTILSKEVTRILRIWTQTILPSAITLSLYFIVFGTLIGPRIGEVNGIYYIDFIVPGLIMMAIITNSYSNVSSSFFGSKFQKNLEEMLVSPLPNHMIILGYVLGGVFRGLLVGLVVTLVSLFFTELNIHNFWVLGFTAFMTAFVFSTAGFLNGLFATKFDDVAIVPTFVLTPLTYLGGVFFSISMLPPFWGGVAQLNPILYMVNAFRYGFLGITDISLYFALGMMVVFGVGFFVACLYLLKRGKGIRS